MQSSMDTNDISSESLVTDELRIKDTSITEITSDFKSKDIRQLVTAKALNDAMRNLKKEFEFTTSSDHEVEDTSVITSSTMSKNLDDIETDPVHGFEVSGFKQEGYIRSYIDNDQIENPFIKIPNRAIKYNGKYVLFIELVSLASYSSLQVKNSDGKVFATLSKSGSHAVIVDIEDNDYEEVYLVPDSTLGTTNTKTIISSIGWHFVRPRLTAYLEHIIKTLNLDSVEIINDKLTELFTNFKETHMVSIIEDLKVKFDEFMGNHLQEENPHKITHSMIEAAHKQHRHTPDQCGAAPKDHTHDLSDLNVAPLNHTHDLDDLGAARKDHNHDTRYMLKTDIVAPKRILPGIIIEGNTGRLPESLDYVRITKPTTNILTKVLNHQEDTSYSYLTGEVLSNTETTNNTKLSHVFAKGKFATLEHKNTCIIEYRLHQFRKVKQVKFTYNLSINNKPNSITVTNGKASLAPSSALSWVGNTFTLPIDSTKPEMQTIGFKFENFDNVNDWSINIEVEFADLGSFMFGIDKSLICAYEHENTITKSGKMNNHLLFDIPNMSEGHTYFIALKEDSVDPNKNQVHISEIPPMYGSIKNGVLALVDKYQISNSDPYFGNISCSDEHQNHPIRNIFKVGEEVYRTNDNVKQSIITHDYTKLQKIQDLTLTFNKDYQVPETIKVEGVLGDGTTATFFDGKYEPVFNEYSKYVDFEITVNSEIKILKVTLSGGAQSTYTHLANLKVYFDSEFYNTTSLIWEDKERKRFVGTITKHQDTYTCYSYPLGDVVYLPINNFLKSERDGIYKVMNPFGTRQLDIKILCEDEDDSPISPIAYVEHVTNNEIAIKTVTEHNYGLMVKRPW